VVKRHRTELRGARINLFGETRTALCRDQLVDPADRGLHIFTEVTESKSVVVVGRPVFDSGSESVECIPKLFEERVHSRFIRQRATGGSDVVTEERLCGPGHASDILVSARVREEPALGHLSPKLVHRLLLERAFRGPELNRTGTVDSYFGLPAACSWRLTATQQSHRRLVARAER
jgi:hypothetical protein